MHTPAGIMKTMLLLAVVGATALAAATASADPPEHASSSSAPWLTHPSAAVSNNPFSSSNAAMQMRAASGSSAARAHHVTHAATSHAGMEPGLTAGLRPTPPVLVTAPVYKAPPTVTADAGARRAYFFQHLAVQKQHKS